MTLVTYCDVIVDFKIDGVLIVPPPFSIELTDPEPAIEQTSRGYSVATLRTGSRVVVTWGESFTSAESVNAVRAALGSTLAHTFSWSEPDGETYSFDVIIEPVETSFDQATPGFYQPLVVSGDERAPARTH